MCDCKFVHKLQQETLFVLDHSNGFLKEIATLEISWKIFYKIQYGGKKKGLQDWYSGFTQNSQIYYGGSNMED